MDRMLVAVFDNEAEALRGRQALEDLDREGVITLYADALFLKHADGTATLLETEEVFPTGTLVGTALGSLIGLLGGPTGLAVGALSGATLGSLADLDVALVGADFVDDVARLLAPNKVALAAEIDEESTGAVDARLEAVGGIVNRRAVTASRHDPFEEDLAAMKADLGQFKAELAQERSDRKAKLQEKIDRLDARILARIEESDRRYDTAEKQRRIKRAILKKNAIATGRAIRDLANTPVL